MINKNIVYSHITEIQTHKDDSHIHPRAELYPNMFVLYPIASVENNRKPAENMQATNHKQTANHQDTCSQQITDIM